MAFSTKIGSLAAALLVAWMGVQLGASQLARGAQAAAESTQTGSQLMVPRTDAELSLEQAEGRLPNLLANLRFRRQAAALGRKLQQLTSAEPQILDSLAKPTQQHEQQMVPLAARRDASQPAAASANLLPSLQLTNQRLFEDEQAIRSQLPDLIAQAHTDKTVERALLKMLIDASLRSALSTMASPEQQQVAPGAGGPLPFANSWLRDLDGATEPLPARLARLEQHGDYANLDPLSLGANSGADSLSQLPPDQYQSGLMDKREYIKPCSFNAVSCVRTPFRKL